MISEDKPLVTNEWNLEANELAWYNPEAWKKIMLPNRKDMPPPQQWGVPAQLAKPMIDYYIKLHIFTGRFI